jgi:hypothetical protein
MASATPAVQVPIPGRPSLVFPSVNRLGAETMGHNWRFLTQAFHHQREPSGDGSRELPASLDLPGVLQLGGL